MSEQTVIKEMKDDDDMKMKNPFWVFPTYIRPLEIKILAVSSKPPFVLSQLFDSEMCLFV